MPKFAHPTYNRRPNKRRALAAAGGGPEKRPKSGSNVSHAHNKTKRLFRPNLQKAKILVDGKLVSVRVPASTLRTLSKQQKDRPKQTKKAKPRASARPKAAQKK